jgi:hypothetical protein
MYGPLSAFFGANRLAQFTFSTAIFALQQVFACQAMTSNALFSSRCAHD